MQRLIWNSVRCVHCGACVGQCSHGAFLVQSKTGETAFRANECQACKRCIPACSYGAVEITTEHTVDGNKSI